MNKSEKALDELKKGIQTYVNRMLELAPFDKTMVGIVKTSHDNNLYTVTINQQDYNNVNCLFKGLINVGDVVKVRIPQNNNNLMYIEGKLNAEVQGGGGGTTDYNDLSNKPQINGISLSGNKTTSQLGINIPTKTSDLTNDSDFVSDSNYVHTDNNYTTTDKNIVGNVTSNLANKVDKVNGKSLSTNDFTTACMNKLNGIATGAEVNVQADWDETDTTKDSYIKNKPNIPSEVVVDTSLSTTSVNPVQNKVITTELNKKANASSVPTNSAIIDLIYPVGSIYTSTINKNPSTYFGGTWSSIGKSYLIINNGTTNTTQYKWKRTA
jgi:hypothetical protein